MGISDKAAPDVKDNLRVGDRVVSVESSVGAQMWEVHSTDGLTSAVTSRLPGQAVRILFERVGEKKDEISTAADQSSDSTPTFDAVFGFRNAGQQHAGRAAGVQSSRYEWQYYFLRRASGQR